MRKCPTCRKRMTCFGSLGNYWCSRCGTTSNAGKVSVRTIEGLPKDAREWTEDDWRTLHYHMEAAKREIAERHAKQEENPCS